MINGWLILDIALGIVAGDLLRITLKDTRDWWNTRGASVKTVTGSDESKESEESDWQFLWDNAPESAKEEVRRFFEDRRLRLRAQELNLWPYLWSAASEDTKQKLRDRWRALNIPPRFIG